MVMPPLRCGHTGSDKEDSRERNNAREGEDVQICLIFTNLYS